MKNMLLLFAIVTFSFMSCEKSSDVQISNMPEGYTLGDGESLTSDEINNLPYILKTGDGFLRGLVCEWEGGLPTGNCQVDCSDGDHCGVVQYTNQTGTYIGIECLDAVGAPIRADCFIAQ